MIQIEWERRRNSTARFEYSDKYYEDFASFKSAIAECIDQANTEHKEKLESLLSWNFQSFKKVEISTI